MFLCSGISIAQNKEILKELALRNAKTTSEATISEDYKTVLKHTHPYLINLMGGNENASEIIKASFKELRSKGIVYEKAEILSVSDVVFEQDEYRCLVKGYNQMKLPNLRVKATSYLMGFYNAKDSIWYFIEADKMNNKELADTLFPGFKTKLEIPKDVVETEEIKE